MICLVGCRRDLDLSKINDHSIHSFIHSFISFIDGGSSRPGRQCVCVKCPKDRRQQEKSDQNSVMVCRLYENEVQVTTTAKK